MSSISETVRQYATKFGVPERVLDAVVQAESGGNVRATGDNGSSFGLLQLHRGGQAPSNLSNEQLYDPGTNLSIGLPYIANAWKSLGSSFDNSLSWWQKFGSLSGHPGGIAGQDVANINESISLKNAYTANALSGGNAQAVSSSSSSSSSSASKSSGGLLAPLNDSLVSLGFVLLMVLVASVLIIIGGLIITS